MSTRHYTFRTSGNPLVQAVWLVVGVAVLAAAVVMGALVLTALLALGVVAAAVFAVRVWWLKRKLERAAAFDANAGHSTGEGSAERSEPRLIEAEYTVVSERDAADAAPSDADAREAEAPDADARDAGGREARERASRRVSR